MSSLNREIVFLILQFLEDEKYKESMHRLEQESGFFFNLKYFEEKVLAGEWDEVEKYLSGFTKVDDNKYSTKIFFDIRKQKYLEALDRHDRAEAVEILVKDLKVFSTFNEIYKEFTQLLTLDNFRENEQLSTYRDTKSARSIMLTELNKLIRANPLFRDKLAFPTLNAPHLRILINQSLNWQYQLNPSPNPDIKTMFTDHTCAPPNGARASPVSVPLAAVPRAASIYIPLGSHGPFPPTAASTNANSSAGWMANWMANAVAASSVPSGGVTASSISIASNQVPIVKRPRTPRTAIGLTDYSNNESEQLMKHLQPGAHPSEEVTYPAPLPQVKWSLEDLPRIVACSLNQGSTVTSLDFHPSQNTLLLVGSTNGEITLWEIGFREKLVSKPFKIWDMAGCSQQFQNAIMKDSSISITHVAWSPDGNFIGVAFTKHLIHLHAHQSPIDLPLLKEIDAHFGAVNDIVFSHRNKQLCMVTCGEDKLIKVWDLNGAKLHIFEGHEASVYSICPHRRECIQFIFSTSVDGKIKAWLYDNAGSVVDYEIPGRWCMTMRYSADGSRLFSCGTSKDGGCFLVEWNESEGTIKRIYFGFRKKSTTVVQFDTAQNHFLAAGEDNQIKFWDVDNINMLISTDAEGGLPSRPHLRFNKEGNLLAVTTVDNGFKILANADGLRVLRSFGNCSFEAFKAQYEVKNGGDLTPKIIGSKARVSEELPDRPKLWELTEILNPQQCRVVTMPDNTDPTNRIARLLYTNSGVGILALASNGIQRLWKWSRSEQNPSGKATASVVPQHWQPSNGLLMTNDTSDVNLEEAVPCIALSKNDRYVVSACGGKVSLFNMLTFKVMTTSMPPPPASTFLAFHPQDNNIIAIGMEDSTIHIYNVRVDEVKTKLKGHQKRVSGLAFSSSHRILVSSGADAQLCTWNTEKWEKKKSITIMPAGKATAGDTRVQFSSDQSRLLVVHETQLSIYDASKIHDASKTEFLHQWIPQGALSAPISYASYSCNSQLIYASFTDGNIGVFNAESLTLRCRIATSAYMSPALATSNPPTHPLVIAAHPLESNQFAVGLSDGAVKVIEPLESDGKWGTPPSSVASNPSEQQ